MRPGCLLIMYYTTFKQTIQPPSHNLQAGSCWHRLRASEYTTRCKACFGELPLPMSCLSLPIESFHSATVGLHECLPWTIVSSEGRSAFECSAADKALIRTYPPPDVRDAFRISELRMRLEAPARSSVSRYLITPGQASAHHKIQRRENRTSDPQALQGLCRARPGLPLNCGDHSPTQPVVKRSLPPSGPRSPDTRKPVGLISHFLEKRGGFHHERLALPGRFVAFPAAALYSRPGNKLQRRKTQARAVRDRQVQAVELALSPRASSQDTSGQSQM